MYWNTLASTQGHPKAVFDIGFIYLANRSKDGESWLATAMLEGRFGWFADTIIGQHVKLDRNNPQEMADFLFMQLILQPEKTMSLKDIVNLVRVMDKSPNI